MSATECLPQTEAGIARAAMMLRDGRLVAFATETVYGLGGRADRASSVAAIYEAKRRPALNPLICHYPDLDACVPDVVLPPQAQALAAAFWPGPLTLVLPRRATARIVPEACVAGTVAVRVPGHALARRLLHEVGVPVAAPSANMSGRVSPTTALHVLDGLEGRIAAVLDGGACRVGLESTVVDLSMGRPALLRPGGIDRAQIEALIGPLGVAADGPVRGPGQSASHYAPLLPLRLEARWCGPDEALLAFGPPVGTPGAVFQLSAAAALEEGGARLFAGLRWLDSEAARRGLLGLAAMSVPEIGLGVAINDRLRRAAA